MAKFNIFLTIGFYDVEADNEKEALAKVEELVKKDPVYYIEEGLDDAIIDDSETEEDLEGCK